MRWMFPSCSSIIGEVGAWRDPSCDGCFLPPALSLDRLVPGGPDPYQNERTPPALSLDRTAPDGPDTIHNERTYSLISSFLG